MHVKSWTLPRVFLGIVFLGAGIYRVFFFDDAKNEMAALGLPWFLAVVVIFLEIVGGTMLVADRKPNVAAGFLGFMILLGIAAGLLSRWDSIFGGLRELFTFNATPVSMLLHVAFIVMLAGIALRKPGE
ncbi:DoxX family membrane protein [Candidatus Woesearchaeota archaeon]|nr:DoxX family membrane protein [Candidatus Woesearchaeota archaeon]